MQNYYKIFLTDMSSFKKFLLYMIIIMGFLGSAFFCFDIGPFSIFPFRIFISILLIYFISYLFCNCKLNISKIKVRNYILYLIIWLFYSILSIVWAASKIAAVRNIIFLFIGVSLIIFIVLYFNKLKDLKLFYNIWIFILVPLTIIGLWEVFTGNHLPVSSLYLSEHPVKRFMPSAVFHNPNDFATYLAISTPFLLSFINHQKYLFKKVFGLILLFLSLFLILKTFSRVNYLAVFIEFAFFFVFILKIKGKFKTVIIVVLLFIFLYVLFTKHTMELLQNINVQISSLFIQSKMFKGSIAMRYNLIKNSLIFLFKSAGFGVGAGNLEYYMSHFAKYETWGILNVHNWWIEILTNYGVFIFTGYLIFYLTLIFNLYKACKRIVNKTEKMICEALIVSLIGFSFASIGPSSIIAFKPQWLLFAFALAFLNYYRLNKVKKYENISNFSHVPINFQ